MGVKFRLKGAVNNSFPLKIEELIDVQRVVDNKAVMVKEPHTKKVHLKGGTEYDSEHFNLSFEKIKEQLGKAIEWSDFKEPEDTGQTEVAEPQRSADGVAEVPK